MNAVTFRGIQVRPSQIEQRAILSFTRWPTCRAEKQSVREFNHTRVPDDHTVVASTRDKASLEGHSMFRGLSLILRRNPPDTKGNNYAHIHIRCALLFPSGKLRVRRMLPSPVLLLRSLLVGPIRLVSERVGSLPPRDRASGYS